MSLTRTSIGTRELPIGRRGAFSQRDGKSRSRHRVALVLHGADEAAGIRAAAINLSRALRAEFDTLLVTALSAETATFGDPEWIPTSLSLRSGGRAWSRRLRRPWEFLVIAYRLRRLIADEEIDTVIGFQHQTAAMAAFALPTSVANISYEHAPFSSVTGIWDKLRRWSYQRVDAVVVLGREDCTKFATVAGRVLLIPHGVEPRLPDAFEKREAFLLFVGPIAYRTELDRLLWALREPLTVHDKWKLVIVASVEVERSECWYISYLRHLTELLHLTASVELETAATGIECWYQRASIFVMGSRPEEFPAALLEAKARGLPVISYDCSIGHREIVRHGVDGFVCADSTAFADAATELMDAPLLRQRMGEAAVEDVRQRFTTTQVCRQWSDLIEAVHRDRTTR